MAQKTKRELPEDFGNCEPHEQAAWFTRRNEQIDGTVARRNHEIDRQIDADIEEGLKQFAAEWTPEVTTARRAEWNAAIKAGRVTGRNGKVDQHKLNALQAELGWTLADLKRAVRG